LVPRQLIPATHEDRLAMRASAGKRLTLIAASFARLAGRPLVVTGPLEQALWEAPRAIVAHGTELEPLFFYGNRLALRLFAMRAADFIGLPSHRSAEPALREERAAMLARLDRDQMIDDYSGVRIAADGGRFRIERAHVWNLVDDAGARQGQAASFADWAFL
jgi:hypothetical protein